FTIGELQRQHAHADQVAAVDSLVAGGDHGLDPEQHCAFGGPVAAAAGAVFVPGDHDQRHLVSDVLHRRVVDAHHLAIGQVPGPTAFGARSHLVANADVGERAANHHTVVSA